ncbi:hypothetical protein EDC01DRAFT_626861 [Geopyxis carbonaria]|nr:hypothetical protein EDC01DRAFT_626861 [Geopyxis carbonaria]
MLKIPLAILALWSSFGSAGPPAESSRADTACRMLGRLFAADTAAPSNSSFTTLATENWSQTSWLTPACIITPHTGAATARALQAIARAGAPFAVRSGGHSPNRGWGNVDGGLLVDLQHLDTVALGTRHGGDVVALGVGNRWGAVYSALNGNGVAPLGGRSPGVGVGGLVTGGGLSLLSNQRGLVADSVLEFEVVLASGKRVVADRSRHSDLFWALKGGSSNFGIVTSVTLPVYPLPAVWFSVLTFAPNATSTLLATLAALQAPGGGLDADPSSDIEIGITHSSTTVLLFRSQTDQARPASFSAFFAIPTLVPPQFGVAPYSTLLGLVGAAASGAAARHEYRTLSTGIGAELYGDVVRIWKDATAPYEGIANFSLVPQPVGARHVRKARGNPMGLGDAPHTWWGIFTDWADPEHDDTLRQLGQDIGRKIDALAQAQGRHVPYIFMNDAAADQEVLQSYGAANLQKLRTVSRKYDPQRVFQKQQYGGFKVGV